MSGSDVVLPVGAMVKFRSERLRYTVQASNSRYAVCNKPFNPRRTVLYTIVDLRDEVRGPENLIFGFGAETREQCEDMLDRLVAGDSDISHRRVIDLDIEAVFLPKQMHRLADAFAADGQ